MKRKIIKILALIAIILLVFEIYTYGNTSKINYIPLGDSLALGQNPYGNIDKSYTDYLKNYLKKKNKLLYYTKEYPKSGYTTNDIINDIKNNNKLKKDLRESDLVTVSIGANDLLHKIDLENLDVKDILSLREEVKKIKPSIDNCIKEIRKFAKEDIVIIGYYNPIPFLFNISGSNLDTLFAYIDSVYQEIADKYNCKYISIYEMFKKNSSFLPNSDDIHPNLEGYKSIANKIIKELDM